ncbi:MAG: hypothetical protein ACTS6P_00870 [Candidatus Hodgkinia cicadicola]
MMNCDDPILFKREEAIGSNGLNKIAAYGIAFRGRRSGSCQS